MSKCIDITGQRFGNITILRRVENTKDGQAQFEYQCDCGIIKIGRGKDIRNGKIVSCGCKFSQHNQTDIFGQTFGELTAIKYEYTKNKKPYWLFICSCGNTTIKCKSDVMNGRTQSCGCKTNLWRSISHKIVEEPGTIYNYLRVEEPATPITEMGDSEYWCTCLLCGRRVRVKSTSFRSGNTKSCGCLNSYQEQEIRRILIKNKINYKSQYTFSDLLSEKRAKLRFDFGILDGNNNLLGLIEYHGIQHFVDTGEFGRQQREVTDGQKQNYCLKNKIPLLILTKDNNLELDIIKFYNEVV